VVWLHKDCLLGIGGGRALFGVMVFRWASGLLWHCSSFSIYYSFIFMQLNLYV
jgi:hypothetical protein